MTKRVLIALIAALAVLIAIAVYILFFLPTERVYDGVLINSALGSLFTRGF